MVIYKYVIYFSFNDDNKPVVLMNDTYLPCYEIEPDGISLLSYYNVINNVYFNEPPWQHTEISDIYQVSDCELAIVDFCVINYTPLKSGEWKEIKEVLNDKKVTIETRNYINEASQKV